MQEKLPAMQAVAKLPSAELEKKLAALKVLNKHLEEERDKLKQDLDARTSELDAEKRRREAAEVYAANVLAKTEVFNDVTREL